MITLESVGRQDLADDSQNEEGREKTSDGYTSVRYKCSISYVDEQAPDSKHLLDGGCLNHDFWVDKNPWVDKLPLVDKHPPKTRNMTKGNKKASRD